MCRDGFSDSYTLCTVSHYLCVCSLKDCEAEEMRPNMTFATRMKREAPSGQGPLPGSTQTPRCSAWQVHPRSCKSMAILLQLRKQVQRGQATPQRPPSSLVAEQGFTLPSSAQLSFSNATSAPRPALAREKVRERAELRIGDVLTATSSGSAQ